MLIPIGPVQRTPLELLRLFATPPTTLRGHLVQFDGSRYEIELSGPDEKETMAPGEFLVVDFGQGETSRRYGRIEKCEDKRVTIALEGRARPRERREFPRIEGTLNLEFAVPRAEARRRLDTWLRAPHLTPATLRWQRANPFMEFSATGFRFLSRVPLTIDHWVHLRFSMPTQLNQQWYGIGEVVRCEPDELVGSYSIALSLLAPSLELSEALIEYTRYCQDQMLGLGDEDE